MATFLEQLDSQLTLLLSTWDLYTSMLAFLLVLVILIPILISAEPDIHPLLLSRQAIPSPVRLPNESAIYRSPDVPFSYPLRSGLDIRDDSTPKWRPGRDGDLRDVWLAVSRGDSKPTITTIFGKETIMNNDLDEITRDVAIVGRHIRDSGAKRVGICLPNSVEYLTAVFACLFYGVTPVLLPDSQAQSTTISMLGRARIDLLITSAGSLALTKCSESLPMLTQVIWIVERTARHMDWAETSQDRAANLTVSVWHDLTQNQRQEQADLPARDEVSEVNVVLVSSDTSGSDFTITEFTQKNITAGVAGLLTALPHRHRLSQSDLLLATDSFCNSYVLCQVLAALFSHASLVINSVAGPDVDLELATRCIAPTVIVTSSNSLRKLHASLAGAPKSVGQVLARRIRLAALGAGRLAPDSMLTRWLDSSSTSSLGGELRLILASQTAEQDITTLGNVMLNDIRAYTGARLCLGLTAEGVAGALTQSYLFDYRPQSHASLGAPVSSVELKLRNEDDSQLSGPTPRGQVTVSGPAVVGGMAELGLRVMIGNDGTLSLAS